MCGVRERDSTGPSLFPSFPSKSSGPKAQETSHSVSDAGLGRAKAGCDQRCCSRDLLKSMFVSPSSPEKSRYMIAAHNHYSRKVPVIVNSENHQLIYLLASLMIASKNYLPLKGKSNGWNKKVYKEIYHSTTQNHGAVWFKTEKLIFPQCHNFSS